MLNNLLNDPIFCVREGNAERSLSLPELLEVLGAGRDIEFVNLRRHQHHAWYAFLVQLAAIACHHNGDDSPAKSAAKWLEALLELGGGEEAWMLVVDDLSKPAFMQPPVPEGNLAALKKCVASPDSLDILIVSRNHDLKRMTILRPAAEHWVFALVSLQTMQGFLGAGNWGISRMNGGPASRAGVGISERDDWGSRFTVETPLLLDHRRQLIADDWPFAGTKGISLLWLVPWNGESSLHFSDLDPLYIEVCRRVRLQGLPPIASAGTTNRSRIEAKDRSGDTGDFWTPLERETRKSLTVQAEGFSYKQLSKIAFSADWLRSPAQEANNNGNLLIGRVLARGKGKTAGYHERVVPIPGKVRKLFGTSSGDALLSARSRQMIELAAMARLKVLKPAVLIQGQGAPDKLIFKDARFDKMLAAFDEKVDDFFFSTLFSSLENDDEVAGALWQKALWREVEGLFKTISSSIPTPEARGYKARAAAERMLHILARKHLPNAFDKEQTHAANGQQ